MRKLDDAMTTRTTTDIVFDQLYDDISSLRLLPGTRISEADIAGQMGVSRQPVRDAFNRLGNLGLLSIRPQRATQVRGFSMEAIQNARFVRLAVELEIVTRACAMWATENSQALDAQIERQRKAVELGEIDQFHALDYDFHELISVSAGYARAFETIQTCKQSVDRLCVLSLRNASEVSSIVADHEEIAAALADRSVARARAAVEKHLSRLDATIEDIHAQHSNYFE